MNWNKFKDSRIEKPEHPGNYIWWSKILKDIPVRWTGSRWTLLNGDTVKSVIWYH